MDRRIIDLKSTTFSGRWVNRRRIADIQETVGLFPGDSRNELAKTVCERLGWKTAKGSYRVGACLGMPGRSRATASSGCRRGGRRASATRGPPTGRPGPPPRTRGRRSPRPSRRCAR